MIAVLGVVQLLGAVGIVVGLAGLVLAREW